MKKQLTGMIFSGLLLTAVAFTAFIPQQKDKNNEKQQQNPGKKEEKGNQGKKGNQGNQGNQGNKGNQGNQGNQGNNDNKGNNGKDNNTGNENKDMDNSYKWNRENFKDRQKIKNQEKVTLCHKFNSANEPAVTIRVSANALKAHMSHGDVMGDCPALTNNRFSNIFTRKRNDYYNYVQESQEQVLYSRSILDYALERLTNSRMQLVEYRNNNMPLADIQRKEATVVELEQNVSLLETLIGGAVALLVNKLL